MDEIRVLSPCGAIGYGFPQASLDEGLKRNPHIIAVDAGSTDPGPYYLGTNEPALSWQSQKNDLEKLLHAQQQAHVPLVVGSAGLGGTKAGVEKTAQIIKDLAAEHGYSLKLATIMADIGKPELQRALNEGRIQDFEHPDTLTETAINRSSNIVGQMGPEPMIEALTGGADVIIAGRAYDPAMMAALPIMKGFDPGLAIHLGKILECGSMAAEPSQATDAILGTIRTDHFIVEPMNPDIRCTVDSVSVHTMYEKDSPLDLAFPGGSINLEQTMFEAINDRAVKVSGTRFNKAAAYTVKLEGAAPVGYRSLFIAGTRDPMFIAQVDEIIAGTAAKTRAAVSYAPDTFELIFRIYGKDGVMGANENVKGISSHELGIIGEVVATTQEIAYEICSFAHGALLHYPFPGRKAIAGNLAFPYSPSDFDVGPVYEFSIYHLLEVEDPLAHFPITYEDVNARELENA